MSGGEYRHCDLCEKKTFYDATLFEFNDDPYERVGAWAVLCCDCALTHDVVVVSKPTNNQGEAQ